jgi:hypothetical protein
LRRIDELIAVSAVLEQANFIPDDPEQQRIFVVSLKKLKGSSMTENTKKELAIFSVGTLVALPVLGGVGLTLLGIVGW